jgi:hypothetical protein
MKETVRDSCVPENSWYSTWRTNSYFRKAKSDFAFHLHEALTALSDSQAAEQFEVPRYIQNAIRFVTQTADAGGT